MATKQKQLSLLVVEDNEDDARTIGELLRACRTIDVVITPCGHLTAALDLSSAQTFDAVLLDLGLPDSNGLETLQQARIALANVPIIVITATNAPELEAAAIAAGAQDFLLKKELSSIVLERAVRYAINRNRTSIALRESEQRLAYSGLHDHLTGLANRTLFLERLQRALQRQHRRSGSGPAAVLAVKIDRFNVINDSVGHAKGDEVLRAVAQRMLGALHAEDTLARVGGSQFAVLLEDVTNAQQPAHLAERLQLELERPVSLGQDEVFTPISIGIATSDDPLASAEDCLRGAEIAMHRARMLGGARYEIFGSDMHTHISERLQLEKAARRGIERDEFIWYFQPIVRLSSGQVAGFEALLRWQHPTRGVLSPAAFLDVCEETGLLVPIFHRLLPQALEQLMVWQAAVESVPPLFININLSHSQFQDPLLLDVIDNALRRFPILPYSLGIELTEDTVMMEGQRAADVLQALKARRLRLLLDDFGTGYSSLSRLQRFPIDDLKVDRSFISGLHQDPECAAITRAIVTLSHALGMSVTAEGIELKDQLDEVNQLRCEYGQGFLFATPVAADRAQQLATMQLFLPTDGAPTTGSGHKGRLLFLDDDLESRQLISRQLEEAGFEVLTANDGEQFLERAAALNPDVVLLDMQLRGMTAIETCRRLKRNIETADIPVLFVAGGRDNDPMIIDALTAGGNDVIFKDTSLPVLVARVLSHVTVARTQARLRELAMTDELTGLYTRRYLFDLLRQAIKSSFRRQRVEGLALLMVDIDHFKQVNDTLGHVAGDGLLRRVARSVVRATRDTDSVARFGGEEIVVVLPDTDVDGALMVAERISTTVPDDCDGQTVSIGIAHLLTPEGPLARAIVDSSHDNGNGDASAGVERLVRRLLLSADEAMCSAKAHGRNGIEVASAVRGVTGMSTAVSPNAATAAPPRTPSSEGNGSGYH